jgi:DNA-binding response OmpR family regulator
LYGLAKTVKEPFIIKEKKCGDRIYRSNDLPHIFERFFQSKQANRPAQGGTGIGLALVSEFTQLLQGKVTVDSTLNKGTYFNVYLPKNSIVPSPELLEQENAAMEFAMEFAIEADTIVPDKSFTILLVEDHAEMRDFITQILSTKYRILIARNGLEGLETLKTTSETIDLIISDVMMPKMDVFEMLQHIKALPKWSYTPVIILTARAAEQDKLQTFTIGVDDYLTKLFSVEELKARIKNLLSNALHRKKFLEEQSELAISNSDLDNVVSQIPEEEQVFEATPNFREVDLVWIKEVENLMLEEVDNESASIADFAQKLHLSERHFSRKLKQLTGMSPAKMFKTVKKIAYSTEFKTVVNFSKSYKKEYGKLPSTYFHTNTK